jgi:hypothetical protein
MRFLASFMDLRMLNDEGRISVYLKLGTFTLPIIVAGIYSLWFIKHQSVTNSIENSICSPT